MIFSNPQFFFEQKFCDPLFHEKKSLTLNLFIITKENDSPLITKR